MGSSAQARIAAGSTVIMGLTVVEITISTPYSNYRWHSVKFVVIESC